MSESQQPAPGGAGMQPPAEADPLALAKKVMLEAQAAKQAAAQERLRRQQAESALRAARGELETRAEGEQRERKRADDLNAALQLAAVELHKASARGLSWALIGNLFSYFSIE